METLVKILGVAPVFIYLCFDRIVINVYLSMLSGPGNVFREESNNRGPRPALRGEQG